jgi:hypothetical protein
MASLEDESIENRARARKLHSTRLCDTLEVELHNGDPFAMQPSEKSKAAFKELVASRAALEDSKRQLHMYLEIRAVENNPVPRDVIKLNEQITETLARSMRVLTNMGYKDANPPISSNWPWGKWGFK